VVEAVVLGLGLGVMVATLLARRRATRTFPSALFWVACVLGVIAVLVGTTVEVSGLLLAVPVVVIASVAVARGGWALGDCGLLLTILGIGSAFAYRVATELDPETGSYADQSAPALVALGTVVSVTAVARSLTRTGRPTRGEGARSWSD
jgi:hypothetical protein